MGGAEADGAHSGSQCRTTFLASRGLPPSPSESSSAAPRSRRWRRRSWQALPGAVAVGANGRTLGVVGFTVVGGRIVEIDLVADPEKLRALKVEP